MTEKNLKARSSTLITRPTGDEESFITNLEYRDPIEKASIWLHKHLVKILRLIDRDKAWYTGASSEVPERLLSEMFEPSQNTLCDRFRYYAEQLKRYAPGQVPIDVVRTDYECGRILVARLYWYCRDRALIKRLSRALEEFWQTVSREERYQRPGYGEALEASVREMVNVFGSLSEYFATFEERLLHPCAEEAMARETLAAVRETRATVARMDARDKRARRNARVTFTVQMQDGAFAIWEAGRFNPAVKQLAKNGRKVTHENVFDYYAKDLRALGIVSAALFTACLGARSDRLRRTGGG